MKGGITVQECENMPISEFVRKLDIFIKLREKENKELAKQTQKK